MGAQMYESHAEIVTWLKLGGKAESCYAGFAQIGEAGFFL
jgi:hypothetical protein